MATDGGALPTTDASAEVVALKRMFSYLVKSLDADSVLPEALSNGLITDPLWSKCQSGELSSYERAEKFLECLLRAVNGVHGKFHTFLQVLDETGQEGIAQRLRGSYNKLYKR